MSDEIKSAVSKVLLWRLWAFDVVIVCAIAGGTFFIGGTGDEDWSELSHSAKVRFWVAMMVVVGTTLRSNISKALQGLSKGDLTPPDMSGDTQMITRQTVQTEQIRTIAAAPAPAPAALNPPAQDGN